MGQFAGLAAPGARSFWRRWRFPSSSGEKISIVVTKISGDNAAASYQHSIVEAIQRALPEVVEVFRWHEELRIDDGHHEVARASAHAVARRILKTKNFTLLISGRVKSQNLLALEITSPHPDSAASKDSFGGQQSYQLPIETLDLPVEFTKDVGSAILACAIAAMRQYHGSAYVAELEATIAQLEKIAAAPLDGAAETKARFLDILALARLSLFEHSGAEADLRAALRASEAAIATAGDVASSADLALARSRQGAIVARIGERSNDVLALQAAADLLRSALLHLSDDVVSWAKVQLSLVAVQITIARLTGSAEPLKEALSLSQHITTDELKQRDERLWAAAKHNHGLALFMFGERRAGDELLNESFVAFQDALEVRTAHSLPRERSDTLVNLAAALIALADRQSNIDWYKQALEHLREAERLVPLDRSPLRWLMIQINVGCALAMIGQAETPKSYEAISVLERARQKEGDIPPRFSRLLSANLARALMFAGRDDDRPTLIRRAKTILEECCRQTGHGNLDELSLTIENDLGLARYYWGIADSDVQSLVEARESFESLRDRLNKTDHPARWMLTKRNLGMVLTALGEKQNSIWTLQESILILSEIASLIPRDSAPIAWAGLQQCTAAAYLALAKQQATKFEHGAGESLDKARQAIEEALIAQGPHQIGPLGLATRKTAADIEEFATSFVQGADRSAA